MPASENDTFSLLRSKYLTMLNNTSPEVSLNPASNIPTALDEEATQAILSILGEPSHTLFLTHHKSLTHCGCSSGDSSKQNEFLTSPMVSPFDNFLSTPSLRNNFDYHFPQIEFLKIASSLCLPRSTRSTHSTHSAHHPVQYLTFT